MNCNGRKLLLVSAAALAFYYNNGSALSADAEDVDYVRVCDVYGAGFYYLPGTQTCFRMGGYLRFDTGFGSLFGIDVDGDEKHDTYYSLKRFQLQTDARTETELGTLRAFTNIDLQTVRDGPEPDSRTEIEMGMIELAGLRVGVNDSLFITQTYYAGGVSNDTVIGYGPFTTSMLSYSYSWASGLSFATSLEGGYGVDTIDSYVPHVVIGGAYTRPWGAVTAVAGYDSNVEEWAGKVRVDWTVNDRFSVFGMAGAKTDDSPPYSEFYGVWGGRWAYWAGGSAKLTDKATANLQVSGDASKNFSVVGNVAFKVADNLTVSPEIGYFDNLGTPDSNAVGGFLRVQQNF
jgi:hypothetical protein